MGDNNIMKYYVGTLKQLAPVEAQICANSGIPNEKGTDKWSDPRETTTTDIYARPVPVNGWNGFTYEQMTAGVTYPETDAANVQFPEVALI